MLPKTKVIYKSTFSTLFKPLLIVLLICGFNYDFLKFRFKFKIILKIYCVILSIVALVAISTFSFGTKTLSQIEYILFIYTILFLNDQTYFFFQKLDTIDTILRIPKSYYFKLKKYSALFVIAICVSRFTFTFSYCFYHVCYENLYFYLLDYFITLSLDINRTWRIIMFDSIRYRLKILRIRLKEGPLKNSYICVLEKRRIVKENKLETCLRLYKEISNAMSLIVPVLNTTIFVSICCSLPKLIYNVYSIMLAANEHIPMYTVGIITVHMITITFFLFSPCVIAELYNVEVENIKLYLINWFIDETDSSVKSDIKKFLFYLKVRPMKINVLRMFAINVRLPLHIVGLCTTYVIVLAQFSRIFE